MEVIMKTNKAIISMAILCVLAGTAANAFLGREGRQAKRQERKARRQERREDRQERREDRREDRQERRDDRQARRAGRREGNTIK